jgi:hypothetical protein
MNTQHSKKALKLIEQIKENPMLVYTMDAIYPKWQNYYDADLFACIRASLGLGSNGKPLFEVID